MMDRSLVGLTDALRVLVAEFDWPGAVGAVRLPEGTLISGASGFANRETGRVMAPTDRMLAGSVGKCVTAAVGGALHLVGVLDLDVPLGTYLGKEPWWSDVPNGAVLTTRRLLQHRTGLTDYVTDSAFLECIQARIGADPDYYMPPAEAAAYAFARGAIGPPGTITLYADTNYLLAGLVLEAAAGEPLFSMARRLVLEPAGMTDTEPSDRRALKRLAAGYRDPTTTAPGQVRVTNPDETLVYNPRTEWAGGGYVATAQDLVRLVDFLYAGGGQDSIPVAELLTTYPVFDRWPGSHYGLGVTIFPTLFGPAIGHTGWIPGYRSIAVHLPAIQTSVAVMVNTDAVGWEALRRSVALVASQAVGLPLPKE